MFKSNNQKQNSLCVVINNGAFKNKQGSIISITKGICDPSLSVYRIKLSNGIETSLLRDQFTIIK